MERIRYTHHKDLIFLNFLELLDFVESEAGNLQLVANSDPFPKGFEEEESCEFAASHFLVFFNLLELEENAIGFEEEVIFRLADFKDSKFVGFCGFRIWGFVDLKIVDKGRAIATIPQFCDLQLTVSFKE